MPYTETYLLARRDYESNLRPTAAFKSALRRPEACWNPVKRKRRYNTLYNAVSPIVHENMYFWQGKYKSYVNFFINIYMAYCKH